jgi:uncharacterized protein YlaI
MLDHAIDVLAKQHKCQMCDAPATHKISEDCLDRHPFTAFLCCECFGRVFGPVAERWCKGE